MRLVGNHLVLVLVAFFLLFAGHLTLSSHPCYIGTEECNIVLGQKDSVSREHFSSDRFERISVLHSKKESLTGLKQAEFWETKEYATRQKSIFEQMEYNIIKQIPVQILNKALKYKVSTIVCKLIITPHDGLVKKVSFRTEYKISSYFSNADILNFENIILNTRFTPEHLTTGDFVVYYWPIHQKTIREHLDSKK